MDAPAITMDVRRIGDGVAVVDIKGEVTAACEPVLMSAYEAASDGRTSRLVLNFAGLEYMNSGGIGMLVTLLVRANRHRQQLAQVLLGPVPDGIAAGPQGAGEWQDADLGAVGEKQQIEFAAFGGARHLGRFGEAGAGMTVRVRMPPSGDMLSGVW